MAILIFLWQGMLLSVRMLCKRSASFTIMMRTCTPRCAFAWATTPNIPIALCGICCPGLARCHVLSPLVNTRQYAQMVCYPWNAAPKTYPALFANQTACGVDFHHGRLFQNTLRRPAAVRQLYDTFDAKSALYAWEHGRCRAWPAHRTLPGILERNMCG